MAKRREILWRGLPEEHDYPAAESYLTLLVSSVVASAIAHDLRHAPVTHFCSKDIRRASGLDLLGESNGHVRRNMKKIERGEPLSPILLVRGSRIGLPGLIIADGFHRVSAVHALDEDALIPAKIV